MNWKTEQKRPEKGRPENLLEKNINFMSALQVKRATVVRAGRSII